MKINIAILLIFSLIIINCGTKYLKPGVYDKKIDIYPVEKEDVVISAKHNSAWIKKDDLIISVRFADFNFIKDNFSIFIIDKKFAKTYSYHLIPFYIGREEKGKTLSFISRLTPFIINIKNKKNNKINIRAAEKSVIVDNLKTQYLSLNYPRLQKANLNYMFRKVQSSLYFRKVARPIFRYSGINVLTDIISEVGKGISFFSVSVNDVKRSLEEIESGKLYKYKYELPESLIIRDGDIFPDVDFSGFLAFPKINKKSTEFKLIIPDVITEFYDNGAPKKMNNFIFNFKQKTAPPVKPYVKNKNTD